MNTKDVFERAKAVLDELEAYQTILDRIEAEKNTVRSKIYEKVKSEYLEKIRQMQEKIHPLLEEIDRAEKELDGRRTDAKAKLDELDEKLEEVLFRMRIGDLPEENAKKERGALEKDKSKADQEIKGLEEELNTLRDLTIRLKSGIETPESPKNTIPSEQTVREPSSNQDTGNDSPAENPQAYSEPESESPVSVPPEDLHAKLTVLEGKDTGSVYLLESDRLQFGRDDDNDIQLLDPKVSRRHFVIERRKLGYYIRDLGSSNGTYLNDGRIEEAALQNKDMIRAGNAVMRFETTKP